MGKILRPRRGTAAVMASGRKDIVLAAGELFFEMPNTGVGTGNGKIKMGDGVTAYKDLAYFMEPTRIETAEIEIVESPRATSKSALDDVTSEKTVGELIGSLKKAISLTKDELEDTVDDRLAEKADADVVDTIVNQLNINNSKFYFDYHNGEYGYNTNSSRGADTFVPFSGSGSLKSGQTICIGAINGQNNDAMIKSPVTAAFTVYALGRRFGAYNPGCAVYVNEEKKFSFNVSASDDQTQKSKKATLNIAKGDTIRVTCSKANNIGMCFMTVVVFYTMP